MRCFGSGDIEVHDDGILAANLVAAVDQVLDSARRMLEIPVIADGIIRQYVNQVRVTELVSVAGVANALGPGLMSHVLSIYTLITRRPLPSGAGPCPASGI